MEPSYQAMFKRWRSDVENAPHDGSIIMGRLTGTNKSMAVHWGCETQRWYKCQGDSTPIDICQWISFTDFADIRSCAWRSF